MTVVYINRFANGTKDYRIEKIVNKVISSKFQKIKN